VDFFKSIENAHKIPEIPSSDNPIPDIFASPELRKLVDAVPHGTEDAIPGIAKYDFTFHSARLVMGREQTDYQNGQAIYEEKDDALRLKEIMDMSLCGKAIINKRLESFLKDGTVVIWIEWLEPSPRMPLTDKKEQGLTTEELLSPEILTTRDSDELSDDEG